jgi:eukaryotic translation initiation factor 2C
MLTKKKVKTEYPLPKRNGKFNTLGREIQLNLNTFDILSPPTKTVQQYDVTIVKKEPSKDPGGPSRVLQMKLWNSKTMLRALGQAPWLFDGNKLAWYVLDFHSIPLKMRC